MRPNSFFSIFWWLNSLDIFNRDDIMNQTNKLVNKIKDLEIEQSNDESKEERSEISKSHLTEENLDEYLEKVETDEHSKELLEKYLAKKSKK